MRNSILFITLIVLAECMSQAQTTQPATQQPLTLQNHSDSLQYSLGVYLGQWLVNNELAITNAGLFTRGLNDALQQQPTALPDSVVNSLVAAGQQSAQNKKNREMEQQLFASLKNKPGIGVLPDGVHYIVLKEGNGLRPAPNDTVVVNAVGVFPDGTVFENTYKSKKPLTMVTSNMIPGLNETVQLMPEGSMWRIFIPSKLAYGEKGLPGIIPPNTALVYEVSLEKVKEGKR